MFRFYMSFILITRTILGLFFILLLSGTEGHAQWSTFKKGLREEVQVAVESDSMLVVHHNGINFSFIVTARETISSDIFPIHPAANDSESETVWQTTERFWTRLNKSSHRIESIFRNDFLQRFQHPIDVLQELENDGTAKTETLPPSPPKSLAERIDEARDRGDFEVASLLALMAQSRGVDSTASAEPELSENFQQSLLREKTVLEKMYTYARGYEEDANWSMAVAVYENLLVLGEFKDARSRLFRLLEKQQQRADSLEIERQRRKTLVAMEPEERLPISSTSETMPGAPGKIAANGINLDLSPPFNDQVEATEPAPQFLLESEQMLAGLYDQANFYIQQKNWQGAHTALQMLGVKNADYRNSRQLLKMVETRIAADNTSLSVWPAGLWVLAVALLAAILVFSENLRAKVWTMLRRYKRAEAIYERQLAQNPGRLKLYGKLAESYLKSNRRDDAALRVFKMVQKLKLKIRHPQAIEQAIKNPRTSRD